MTNPRCVSRAENVAADAAGAAVATPQATIAPSRTVRFRACSKRAFMRCLPYSKHHETAGAVPGANVTEPVRLRGRHDASAADISARVEIAAAWRPILELAGLTTSASETVTRLWVHWLPARALLETSWSRSSIPCRRRCLSAGGPLCRRIASATSWDIATLTPPSSTATSDHRVPFAAPARPYAGPGARDRTPPAAPRLGPTPRRRTPCRSRSPGPT